MVHPLRRSLFLAYTALVAQQQYQCNAFTSHLSTRTQQQLNIRFGSSKFHSLQSGTALYHRATEEEEDRSRPNIVKIKTHEDYVNFLEEDDRICVVKFYANWCKSCQRFGLKYRHLAFEEGDHINIDGTIVYSGEVRFAEVEYTASAKLCKALKVKKLPTVHMYRRGVGKIVDMTCKPSLFHIVEDELHRIMDGGESVQTASIAPEFGKAELEIEVEKIGVPTASANATSAALFDRAMSTGSKMADDVLTSLGKDKVKDGQKEDERTTWFPFRF